MKQLDFNFEPSTPYFDFENAKFEPAGRKQTDKPEFMVDHSGRMALNAAAREKFNLDEYTAVRFAFAGGQLGIQFLWNEKENSFNLTENGKGKKVSARPVAREIFKKTNAPENMNIVFSLESVNKNVYKVDLDSFKLQRKKARNVKKG
jgi:hypothetical protein